MDHTLLHLPSSDKIISALSQCRNLEEKYSLLDKLLSQLVYTDVNKAVKYIDKLKKINSFDVGSKVSLSYFWYKALIENQKYQYKKANDNFLKAVKISEESTDLHLKAALFIDMAGTSINLHKMEEAELLIEKAKKCLKKNPSAFLNARIISREAFIQLHYANYPRAIEGFLKAEKIIRNLSNNEITHKDLFFLQIIQAGLGNLYEIIGDADKSISAYQNAIELAELSDIKTRLSWLCLFVGKGYLVLSNLERATLFFQKVLHIENDDNAFSRASAYANLGYVHLLQNNFHEAQVLLNRAEELFVFIGEKDSENLVSIEIWRAQMAMKCNDFKKAEFYLLHAYRMASKSANVKRLSFICKELATYYAEKAQFKLAYTYEKLHADLSAKYVAELNQHKIWELEAKYDFERRKQEAELLILQANRLQLKALRAQMNPHFLYNALNSIQNYITSNDMTHAAKYLAKFAKLMRQSLEYSDVEVISLEKEIEFLENYLFINEKLRFADRMSYQIKVDDDIEEDLIGVPAMIVQPYLENAIEHGLRSKKDGILIVQFLSFNEQCILCIIEDNGVGREKAMALQRENFKYQHHKSKGTLITEQRLRLLHKSLGAQPAVKIIDLKDTLTGEATGTRVEVLIPLMELDR